MSSKIEIDVSDTLLGKIDSIIDNDIINNRQEAVEHILNRAFAAEQVNTAVILAGGKGTRLQPFTYETPKPLIPVQGKPLVQHILDLLSKYNIRNVIFSIGYMGDKIKEHFGNGHKLGFNISYVEEEEPLGTAGPLNLMKEKLRNPFILLNGDILANINLLDFIMWHHRMDGLATIALKPVKDPSRYGVAKMRGNQILEFIEKPKKTDGIKAGLINAGVYVMEPDVVEYIPEGKAMMEEDVFPRLAEEGRLYGYPFEGQWFDTGTLESYEWAVKQWKGVF